MKKSVIVATVAASMLALSACSDNAGEDVLVTSKVGDITQQDLYNEMKTTVGEQALQLMVIEKVLEDKYEVDEKEVDKQYNETKEQAGDGFDSFLAQQGYTKESYKDMIKLNLLQEKALTDGVEVTDEEVDKYIERMGTELNARHILVDDEATAKEVKAKLDEGGDFAELAKEYSTEPAAQESGGELGWFGPDKMVADFTDAAYNLEVNTISEPVKSDFGYHIIEVTDTRAAEDAEKKEDITDERRAEIKDELIQKKADPNALMDKISKMMVDADIEIKDEDLKDALDQFYGPAGDSKEEQPEDEEKK